MASQPAYAVHYQNYCIPGMQGEPPHIIAKPQWVKLPVNQQTQTICIQTVTCQQPPQQVVYPQGQTTVSYRLNSAGQLFMFKSPWYNPTVGARHWDAAKPMPKEDWFAQGTSKPFY